MKEVISGVPQGSVLGKLLFCLFINDLPDHVKNVTKLFADDLKLVANASEKSEICEDSNVLNYNYNQNTDYILDGVFFKNVD